MLTWSQPLINDLRAAVGNDPFWSHRLDNLVSCKVANESIHLAVLVEPYLQFILDGTKSVESRFSVRRYPPFNCVEEGDVILLKRSSGPIVGICEVSSAWFYHLDPKSWFEIREEFTQALCAQDPDFWRTREAASFATLMRIHRVLAISPTKCNKRDRRGWVVLRTRQERFDFEQPCDP